MDMKVEEKYNSVVVHLKGKLFGGPFAEELSKALHKLMDEVKKILSLILMEFLSLIVPALEF